MNGLLPAGGIGDHRRGITMLETLVAIAVIGILAAILLPAVQGARESARRIQCVSNLHQIGIACHNYESSYGVFPGSPRLGTGHWKRQLLPYLEQPEDAEAVPIYGCPSDTYGSGHIDRSQTSYQVNDGLWAKDGNGFGRGRFPGTQTRPRDFLDGMTASAAFAERLAWPDIAPAVLPPDDFQDLWIRRIRNTAAFIADMDAFADECRNRALPPGSGWYGVWGYNHIIPPNQNSCFNGPKRNPESTRYWAVTATSQHPGGVNVLLSDGAVKFVSDTIDVGVWRSLGTRNGQEVISVNF